MAGEVTAGAPVAERSISFTAPMVLALLAGRKTQTRRVVKPPPAPSDSSSELVTARRCPYGVAGQRLWVREAFRLPSTLDALTPSAAGALALDARRDTPLAPVEYPADGHRRHWPALDPAAVPGRWRSPMFMPRWASRLTLVLTDVRLERLNALSVVDALAEGLADPAVLGTEDAAVDLYRGVWERLHGAGAWQADPWVWVVGFRVDSAG